MASRDAFVESRENLLEHFKQAMSFEGETGKLNQILVKFLTHEEVIAAQLWLRVEGSYEQSISLDRLQSLADYTESQRELSASKRRRYLKAAQLILAVVEYISQYTTTVDKRIIVDVLELADMFSQTGEVPAEIQFLYNSPENWFDSKDPQGELSSTFIGDRNLQKLVEEGYNFGSKDADIVFTLLGQYGLIKITGPNPKMISLPKPATPNSTSIKP